MNIPAVKVAEMAGYRNVVDLARRAGMNLNIQATPSIALGSYEVTPLEIAGAYTIFSNPGLWVKPSFVKAIRDERGDVVFDHKPTQRMALDPRVSYLMTSMMEEVLRTGTGAGVRSRGFYLPAAGKTGTSKDGWFAGFTSKLICVVWVGFDDNRDLDLDGSQSALPIWADFMKRAHENREYSSARGFDAPDGIVSVEVDPLSGQLASAGCPNTRGEVYIAGSQPQEICHLHRGNSGATQVASWDTPDTPAQASPGQRSGTPQPRRVAQNEAEGQPGAAKAPPANGKPKGFFGKIRDMFK
jgi:penicillin-binding protein 1B